MTWIPYFKAVSTLIDGDRIWSSSENEILLYDSKNDMWKIRSILKVEYFNNQDGRNKVL